MGYRKVTLQQIEDAYQASVGQWTGCDWPTKFGKACLNLKGISSAKAKERSDRWGELLLWLLQYPSIPADFTKTKATLKLDFSLPKREKVEAARSVFEKVAGSWERSVIYLAFCERKARFAEEKAGEAVNAVKEGQLMEAFRLIGQAYAAETQLKKKKTKNIVWYRLFCLIRNYMEQNINQ